MVDADTSELLEGGCALLIGTVDDSGMPHATRGWGLDVLDRATGRVRIMLPGDDPVVLANLRANGRLAVTGADIPTLRSIQAKGHLVNIETATAADLRRVARYCDAFFGDIERTDYVPRAISERLLPPSFRACTAIVDEWYDQTPGPKAGIRVGGSAP